MTARGFTLIELLVALAVGSLAIMAAAQIASIGVQSSGRSEQSTELTGRARLMGNQLRSDLTFAGYGSNGSIGVDPTTWAAIGGTFVTPQGRTAIAAVRGVNAAGFAIGGITVQANSDVVQLVVPDPSTTQLIVAPVAEAATSLPLPAAFAGGNGCDFLYVVDHAAPNGGGRTQLLRYNAATTPVTLRDRTLFPYPQGTEVMCARMSTYWVDATDRLHRSDLSGAAGPYVPIGPSGMVTTVSPADVAAPGFVDLQLTFAFSRMASGATPGDHVLGALGGTFAPTVGDWAEIRNVRYTLIARGLRGVGNVGDLISIPVTEDRPALPAIQRSSRVAMQLVSGGAELTNLRYFDDVADANVAVEPY